MMMKRNKCMLATSAIAAALAISTPGVAQQVQPVPTNPVPTTTTTIPTTTDVPPPTDTAPATSPTADTATTDTTSSTTAKKPATLRVKRTSTAATAAAAAARRAEAQSLARTLAARKAAAVRAASPAPAATPPVAAPVAAPAAAVAAPAPKPAPTQPAGGIDERALELGGGALALLALGGGAVALMRRRRRRDEDEAWTDEEVAYHDLPADEPLELDEEPMVAAAPAAVPRHDPATIEPAFIAPPASAFAWNAAPRHDAAQATDDGDDRRPGESWVERAHRGPSPSNPSLSLKKRLKRAAFFDQRERDVAEGKAVPVDADAGLPEAIELEDA